MEIKAFWVTDLLKDLKFKVYPLGVDQRNYNNHSKKWLLCLKSDLNLKSPPFLNADEQATIVLRKLSREFPYTVGIKVSDRELASSDLHHHHSRRCPASWHSWRDNHGRDMKIKLWKHWICLEWSWYKITCKTQQYVQYLLFPIILNDDILIRITTQ